jgi:hypothetical protein
MTSIKFPCFECAHFDNHKGLTCEAFPEGIPKELMFGYVEHATPYPGDKGIRFAQRVIEGERFEPERYEEWVHY